MKPLNEVSNVSIYREDLHVCENELALLNFTHSSLYNATMWIVICSQVWIEYLNFVEENTSHLLCLSNLQIKTITKVSYSATFFSRPFYTLAELFEWHWSIIDGGIVRIVL